MNKIEEIASKQRVFEMLDYMASEIVFNMKKIILNAGNEEDKYAIKHDVDRKSLNITFSLYNTETEVIASKKLDVHQFSRICSHKASLETYFNKVTYDMLEASEKRNTCKEVYL